MAAYKKKCRYNVPLFTLSNLIKYFKMLEVSSASKLDKN